MASRREKELLGIAKKCGTLAIQTHFFKGKLIGEKELQAAENLVAEGFLEYTHVTGVGFHDTLNTDGWTKHFYRLAA